MIIRKLARPIVVLSSFKSYELRCSHYSLNMTHWGMEKYDEAIAVLNSLQSNISVLKEVAEKINIHNTHRSHNIEVIQKYIKRCNIDLDSLSKRVIHVSGTKGKGSTCALVESILRSHGYSTGFYSSPHLFSVTERIRLNGKPIPHDLFTLYFWEIYRQFENNKDTSTDMPGYFKFLTILAYHIFIQEKVDVAIIEVGIGGEYDCTNVIQNTPVVGITSLGFDHMSILGNTIESIAWMKGGIMKKGCLAFTCSDQPTTAMDVLTDRAKEKECQLKIIERNVPVIEELYSSSPTITLNASLAVHLSHSWMNLYCDTHKDCEINHLPEQTVRGIINCTWHGRFHILPKGNITYYLDGAHTAESIFYCAQWFQKIHNSAKSNVKKVLMFNLTANRDSKPLLECLMKSGFDKAFFCPNIRSSTATVPNDIRLKKTVNSDSVLSCSQEIQREWNKLGGCDSESTSSVEEALKRVEDTSNDKVSVLVTGSVHLVGNALSLLQPNLWS